MFNKIILIGHLTKDIEMKYTQGGIAIANTSIAVNRKYKTKSGEEKEEILFVELTFFGKLAEIANQYLKKGKKLLVDGRLKLDRWQDNNGSNRQKHRIIVETLQMLDNKKQDSNNEDAPKQYKPKTAKKSSYPTAEVDTDEIPF
jgi:single-strand DNA-binding protein